MALENKPLVLCILDGLGVNNQIDNSSNAFAIAQTPCLDFLKSNYPYSELVTSGEAVGLPHGQMGNSEVGHMTIGSGRVILQDLLRINEAITNKHLKEHHIIRELINAHKNNNSAVHLLGLCSDGGVHSHIEHMMYIAMILAENDIQVRLHLFLDGRDVGPKTAEIFLKQIDQLINKYNNIQIATISGRFYAMDRDNRWDRIKIAYDAIASGGAIKIDNWQEYLLSQYSKEIYDEFIKPASLQNYMGMQNSDSIIFTNFRSDRIRQLAQSLLDDKFDLFENKNILFKYKVGMTNYSSDLNNILDTLFVEQNIDNNLPQVISLNGKKQLRIAETEKYAHVTFFFNGGREEKYHGEDRILIPSPKVSTYDLAPEMSAFEITEALIKAISSKKYDLIVVNYANCDMVGHSGKLGPAIKAVEIVDSCVKKIFQSIKEVDGVLIITSDHGNVEHMYDTNYNSVHTSHTTNPVPFYFVTDNSNYKNITLKNGNLSDIAPTILKLMNIQIPQEMTGKPLYMDKIC